MYIIFKNSLIDVEKYIQNKNNVVYANLMFYNLTNVYMIYFNFFIYFDLFNYYIKFFWNYRYRNKNNR